MRRAFLVGAITTLLLLGGFGFGIDNLRATQSHPNATLNNNTEFCGDVNCDGQISGSDVFRLADYLFFEGEELCDPWAADVNCNGIIGMDDIHMIALYLFFDIFLNCCE